MKPVLTVMVVDDQPAFRQAAGSVIALTSSAGTSESTETWEVEMVAEAEDLRSALATANEHPTLDVAIVDLHLGRDDGVDVCRQLRALRPELAVVLVSTAALEDLPMDAHTCGALGFIPKSRFVPDVLAEMLAPVAHLRWKT